MKNLPYIILLISILSCNSIQTDEEKVHKLEDETITVFELKESQLIMGERIDGPANIRNKPNGDILFELNNNALVEATTKPENDWYEVLVYADIDYAEYPMDSILKDRPIIVNNDTIGKIFQSHSVSTGQGGDFAYALLYGYTHKNNIRPETVIETVFKYNLTQNGRELSDWRGFIESFQLKDDAIGYAAFKSYYNYENTIEYPSPGFRIVLLFEKELLIGLIHSREFQIQNTKTHKLDWSYYITFFDDYPEKGQLKFVDYMNEWIQGVD